LSRSAREGKEGGKEFVIYRTWRGEMKSSQ